MANMRCALAVISEKIMLMGLELLLVIVDVDVQNLGKEINRKTSMILVTKAENNFPLLALKSYFLLKCFYH